MGEIIPTKTSLGVEVEPAAAALIARCSRGTPRIAGRLVRRVADFAFAQGSRALDLELAARSLEMLGIDRRGPGDADRRYLVRLADLHNGSPVGVETLAAALSDAVDTIEDVIEPYLLQEGLVMRTARGRVLGQAGWRHLGLPRRKIAVPT